MIFKAIIVAFPQSTLYYKCPSCFLGGKNYTTDFFADLKRQECLALCLTTAHLAIGVISWRFCPTNAHLATCQVLFANPLAARTCNTFAHLALCASEIGSIICVC
jgi:hypothetical protein